jgi:SAM-dependent methyltransferase
MSWFHPAFGLVAPDLGWVPAPSYLLRRQRVLRLLEALPHGRLLEIGCGAGALLRDVDRLGFACEAFETSPEALALARHIHHDGRVTIHQHPSFEWCSSFDVVMALEVLEHIEDDRAAISLWRSYLREGGNLVLSVPAHPRRWNASDEWAGHFRRYERTGLLGLLNQAGFVVEHIECYGFPLANLIEPVRALHHRRQLQVHAVSKAQGSARSGIERSLETRLFPLQASFVGVAAMRVFCGIQSLFASTDLGSGYLVRARRR